MKKNKTIGDSLELKNGREGIIEDYDEEFFFVKDSNGALYKIEKDCELQDSRENLLSDEIEIPSEKKETTDKEILSKVNIDYSETDIDGYVVVKLNCKEFDDKKLKDLILKEEGEIDFGSKGERKGLLEDLGYAINEKGVEFDGYTVDEEENSIYFEIPIVKDYLDSKCLTIDESKSEVIEFDEEKDSSSYELNAEIKLNIIMTDEDLKKLLKAYNTTDELLPYFTVHENEIDATVEGYYYTDDYSDDEE